MSEFEDSKRIALERQGWHCLRCGTNIHDRPDGLDAPATTGNCAARRIRRCGIVQQTSSSCAAAETLAVTAGSTSTWQKRSAWG